MKSSVMKSKLKDRETEVDLSKVLLLKHKLHGFIVLTIGYYHETEEGVMTVSGLVVYSDGKYVSIEEWRDAWVNDEFEYYKGVVELSND